MSEAHILTTFLLSHPDDLDELMGLIETIGYQCSREVYTYFLQNPKRIMEPREIFTKLNMPQNSVYRILTKLQELKLIKLVGRVPNDSKKGGNYITLWKLRTKVEGL